MVALLLRAGATPTSVCPAPLYHSPLARAVRDLRVAVDHFVANVNDADTSREYTARTASWVSRRFAIASLLVWSVARARGVEAVAAAAAPGDDPLVRDLLPRCAPFVQRFAHTSHSLFPRRWQRVFFGYLPPLLLRAHPGGFAIALSLAECRPFGSDAGDAAAAALGFVTQGDAARCGRALAVRRAAGAARWALILGPPVCVVLWFSFAALALSTAVCLSLLAAAADLVRPLAHAAHVAASFVGPLAWRGRDAIALAPFRAAHASAALALRAASASGRAVAHVAAWTSALCRRVNEFAW